MNGNEKLYKPREICKIYNISSRTLLNWAYNNQIKYVWTRAGQRRYILPEPSPKNAVLRRKICYCRVSTHEQKKDLERQVEFFRHKYPDHEIVRDIGSGINFKRKGFNGILDSAKNGDIEEIVVTYKDRLCRFGFELIERIVSEWSEGRIMVLNKKETSPEEELVDDLVSIITIFSSRLHGLRSHNIKRQLQEEKERRTRASKNQDTQVQVISD